MRTARWGRLAGCQYVHSFLERLWTERPAAGRICGIASSDESIRAAHEWLDYAASARSATTRAGAPSVLSRRECADGRVETIEPLVGVARHPFASVGCHLPGRGGLAANVTEKSIYDITYLVLANNCGENRQMNVSSGRRLFCAPRMHDLWQRIQHRRYPWRRALPKPTPLRSALREAMFTAHPASRP